MAKSKVAEKEKVVKEQTVSEPTPVAEPVISVEKRLTEVEEWKNEIDADVRRTVKLVTGKAL